MKEVFNWGIIGLGKIAHKFAVGLQSVPGANLHVVASRSEEKAIDFAKSYDCPYALGNYEDIIDVPNLDVVYIATPHHLHLENSLMCLQAGIPVLCEKPFAMNLNEVKSMIALSREKRCFLMEALWTRFHPHIMKIVEMKDNNEFGNIQVVKANFGFKTPYDRESRLFNKSLGGGSLLDIGIYPVFLALLMLGKPDEIEAQATFSDTDVDLTCDIKFRYTSGAEASLYSSFCENIKNEAIIEGEKCTVRIPPMWHEPNFFYKKTGNKEEKAVTFFHRGNGYNYEAKEVQFQIGQGLHESPRMSHEFSMLLMETLDNIRKKIGLTYPAHEEAGFHDNKQGKADNK